MGRYYYGDISGKFWVAVQSSDDASYFGAEPEFQHEFYDCGCQIEIYEEEHPDLNDELYCHSCFTSLEAHQEQAQVKQTWFLRELSFHFNTDNATLLKKKINLLTRKVGQFMAGYTIEGEEEFTYTYTIPTELNNTITSEQRTLIARLCLGKLIAHCLDKKGECCFFAEI